MEPFEQEDRAWLSLFAQASNHSTRFDAGDLVIDNMLQVAPEVASKYPEVALLLGIVSARTAAKECEDRSASKWARLIAQLDALMELLPEPTLAKLRALLKRTDRGSIEAGKLLCAVDGALNHLQECILESTDSLAKRSDELETEFTEDFPFTA